MKRLVYLLLAVISIAFCSCQEEPEQKKDRDLYCGFYALDTSGGIVLQGEKGTVAYGKPYEFKMNNTNVKLEILPIQTTADMVISSGYWGTMKGTCKKDSDYSHYLQFEDKTTENNDSSGSVTTKIIMKTHNHKARLSDNNAKLTWLTDVDLEIYGNYTLLYKGSFTVTNRAVKLY